MFAPLINYSDNNVNNSTNSFNSPLILDSDMTYQSIKKIINDDEISIFSEENEANINESLTDYIKEAKIQENRAFSPLYICKKTPLEALKTYFDPYPFLFLRKKMFFIKW